MPGEGVIHDLRHWDFTMLDDEVIDDLPMTTAALAAYWSIARRARLDPQGRTQDPTAKLMRGARIKKKATWMRARRVLENLELIRVVDTGPNTPPDIYLLPVPKRRASPKRDPYRLGATTTSGLAARPKRDLPPGRKGTPAISSSENLREREEGASRGKGPEPDRTSNFARAFRQRTGRWPDGGT